MGALEYGSKSYLQRSSLLNVKPGEIGLPTGFMENFNAAVEDFDFNYKSTSRTNILEPVIDDQLKRIYQNENPDIRFKPSYHKEAEKEWKPIDLDVHTDFTTTDFLENGKLTGTFKQRQEAYRDMTPYILGLQKKYPDAGIKTYDQIMADARNKAQIIKEKLETITDNRTWGGVAGNLSGVMKSAITDPIVLGSMAFGTGKITGATKGVNALKAFITEFFIGAGSESIIQLAPGLVKDWQAELEQPWTLKQAAITILTVGGFAGVARAGGSYVVDIVEAGKASKILRAKGETAKADVLDNFIDLYQSAPRAADVLNDEAHFKALDDIQRAVDEGKVGAELNAEVERILAATEVERIVTRTSEIENLSRTNFEDYLHNRDFKYSKINEKGKHEVDEFLYVKTVLARNPIEKQLSMHMDKPELVKKAWDELGVVWSSEKVNWVKPPKNIQKYFDGKEKLQVATEKDLDNVFLKTTGRKTIYHATDELFDEFDIEKTADGTIWFTDRKDIIDSGQLSGVGSRKHTVERVINEEELKLGGWEEADKFSTDELIAQGYDGLKLVDADETTYQIYFPEKLQKADELLKQTELRLEPEIGQAVRLKDLDEASQTEAEFVFRSKQRESIKTIDDLYGKNNEIAIAHQKRINRVGRQIKKETGIDYKPPPFRAAKDQIKDRARVEQKVKTKYGGNYGLITDIVRASFVIEKTADVARVVKRLEKEFKILDEGFNHSAGNYLDRKLLVRFKDGRIGEIQIVEKNFYHAKYKEGGNELYYKWRNIDKAKDPEKWSLALKEMEDLYGAALKRSNLEWKTLSETLLASEKTSLKGTSRQASPGSALEKALADSGESTKTAGIPSHQAKPVTLSQSNKSIDQIIRQDTESIYLNDPELKRLMDEEVIEAQRIIDEAGDDLEVPFTLIDDLGNEVTIVEGVKKVFNDLDEEQNSLDSLNKCMGRAA